MAVVLGYNKALREQVTRRFTCHNCAANVEYTKRDIDPIFSFLAVRCPACSEVYKFISNPFKS